MQATLSKINDKVAVRNRAIDLIKLIALFTMVIDHLRFIFPTFQMQLIAIGRWAFIFFCFAIALNSFKAISAGKTKTIKSYFINLVLFSLISEIPYRLLVVKTDGILNIMPTLLLGFLFVVLLNAKLNTIIKITSVTLLLVISFFMQDHLQYGLAGALLIVFFYGFIQASSRLEKSIFFVVALFFALLCNLQYYLPIIQVMGFNNVYIRPLLISIVLAVGAVTFLASLKPEAINFYVPKVGKWAYWFYPVHMLILVGLIKILSIS